MPLLAFMSIYAVWSNIRRSTCLTEAATAHVTFILRALKCTPDAWG
jgi:hypothetical protein